MNHAPRGFVALISTIIMSLTLLAVIMASASQAIYARMDQFDAKNGLGAYEAVRGCLAIAEAAAISSENSPPQLVFGDSHCDFGSAVIGREGESVRAYSLSFRSDGSAIETPLQTVPP